MDLEEITASIRPVALGRAVANLINNAFTYGEAPVVVRLRGDTQQVHIEVWDQGSGIPQDQWDRALQPFQRLDDARGEQGHCGLGLAIVSHVVQGHNGSIHIRRSGGPQGNEPGCFCVAVSIPVSTPRAAANIQKT